MRNFHPRPIAAAVSEGAVGQNTKWSFELLASIPALAIKVPPLIASGPIRAYVAAAGIALGLVVVWAPFAVLGYPHGPHRLSNGRHPLFPPLVPEQPGLWAQMGEAVGAFPDFDPR